MDTNTNRYFLLICESLKKKRKNKQNLIRGLKQDEMEETSEDATFYLF